jgi:hypothetical protein
MADLQTLDFSRNENCKLFQEYFSCIRFHDAGKFFVGNVLDIQLKGQSLGTAEVVAVRQCQYKHFSDVLSYLDSGKPLQLLAAGIKKQQPDVTAETEFDHTVLHYISRNLELQATMIMAWYQDIYDLHKNLPPNKPTGNEQFKIQ